MNFSSGAALAIPQWGGSAGRHDLPLLICKALQEAGRRHIDRIARAKWQIVQPPQAKVWPI